ncbi:MAG: hypothetical protein K2H85_04375, partial [Allobaculum sp.]|nr:hypothetical protein [Allobaculum sp.]
ERILTMKKFILGAITSALLLPTPVLVAEEDFQSFEEVENEIVLEAAQAEIPMEMSETAAKTFTITYTDSSKNKAQVGKITLTEGNNDKNLKLVIASLPAGYRFDTAPTSISAETQTISVSSYTSPEDSTVLKNSTLPLYLQCNVSTNDNDPLLIEFNNWSDATGSDTNVKSITQDKLNAALNNKLYKVPYGISYQDLRPVYAKEGNTSKVIAYALNTPITLSKESLDEMEDQTISVKLAGGLTCKLRIGDLNFDKNKGTITITPTNLTTALTNLTKEDGESKSNLIFKVTQLTKDKKSSLNCSIFENQPLNLDGVEGTVSYTRDTVVPLELKSNGVNILGSNETVSVLYKDITDSSGKVTETQTKKYIESNWKRLKFISSLEFNLTLSLQELKNDDLKFQGINEIANPITINVSPLQNLAVYEKEDYTIRFVDSTTDQLIETDTRTWSKFFKKNASSVFTQDDMITNFIPAKYKIALQQTPKSTANTKKKPTTDGNFILSIYQTNATIYLTSTSNSHSSGGTTNTPEPEEPTTPDTPTTPEEPMAPSIPSQGRSVMYRVYNPQTHEHLYTQDAGERDNLLASGWNDEGHGWTAPAISSYKVYRVFNPNSGEHHYTMDQNEYDTLISYGWTGEGTAFFSANDVDNKVTLYRLYHPNAPESAKHHYTMDENERNQMIADGWIPEGTAWYGLPN